MEKIKNFVAYLNEQVENNACYLWGGQGEVVKNMKIGVIRKMETSDENAGRVIARIAQLIRTGKLTNETRFYDCSGLGVNWFLEHEMINTDTTAHGLYCMCKPIKLEDIKKGDMVFKVDSKNHASHVGYVVDNRKTVVEMFGRDVGILKCKMGNGSAFNVAGRPNFKWE